MPGAHQTGLGNRGSRVCQAALLLALLCGCAWDGEAKVDDAARQAAAGEGAIRLGKTAPDPAAGYAAGTGTAQPAAPQEADEELTVTAERLAPTFAERQQIYDELAKAQELYRRNRIKDALPYLERTAKSGFKDSQAKMGHILLQGMGDVERDSLSAVGWLGVASSGRTSPAIRNYFNDIWQRIPDRHVPVFEEAVQEYTNRYGAHATGVVCAMRRSIRTHFKALECYFEADLEDDVRRGMEVRRASDEAEGRVRELRERVMLECVGPSGAVNPQCVP